MLVFALDGSHTKQRKKYEIEDGHQISSNKICMTKKCKAMLMEKNLHKLIQQVAYPILYTVLYIPGSAGCLPSTVSPAHFLAKKSCCFG